VSHFHRKFESLLSSKYFYFHIPLNVHSFTSLKFHFHSLSIRFILILSSNFIDNSLDSHIKNDFTSITNQTLTSKQINFSIVSLIIQRSASFDLLSYARHNSSLSTLIIDCSPLSLTVHFHLLIFSSTTHSPRINIGEKVLGIAICRLCVMFKRVDV
jgi:hypothetical protein